MRTLFAMRLLYSRSYPLKLMSIPESSTSNVIGKLFLRNFFNDVDFDKF